jgi:hypothetical protein
MIKLVFGLLGFITHSFFAVASPEVVEQETIECLVFADKLLKPNSPIVKAQFLRFCKLSD